MRSKYFFILLSFCLSVVVSQNLTGIKFETSREKQKRILTGISILSAEYIAGYSLAYSMWWPEGFRSINPFSNIGEKEPFIVDDLIHSIGNASSQEIHYAIMKTYFHIESPWPSMILTSLSWFSIEVLDAMEKRNGWRLSINDELGNLAGMALWYYRYQHPESRLFLRLGFRQWNEASDYIKSLPLLFTDRDTYGRKHNHDKYAIVKTELIYLFDNNFYAGTAVSRAAANSSKNVWGLTIGLDISNILNQSTQGWWNKPMGFFHRHFTLNLSFTYWDDGKLTPI